MSLVIKKTSWEDYLDPTGESHVKALIMGVHDAGKTRSASFWPKPIFADTEDGRMSIADRAVPYARIRSSADMDALLEAMRKDGLRAPASREYGTLVIDTFDAYQRTIIQERLKAERKESLSGWADWGYLDGKMTQLIEKLLNLPMNIIVNLHTKDVNDSLDGDDGDDAKSILVKKARLKGDIKDSIFQDFDLIGQMETYFVAEKGERVIKRHIRWKSDPRNPNPRDRSGQLPRFTDVDFTDQDYWRIFNAMAKGLDNLPAPEIVTTLETGTPDTEVAPVGPSETGGPVPVADDATKVKGARAPAAKKAVAKKATPAKPEPAAEPAAAKPNVQVEEVGETKAPVEPTPAPEEKPAPSSENGKGTAEVPIVLEQNAAVALELLGEGKLRSLEHVHSSNGVCIKNGFGGNCDPVEDPWKPEDEAAAPVSTPVQEAAPEVEEPPAEEPTAESAEALVAEQLGGEEVGRTEVETECGFIPEPQRKFTDQPMGCGKDLSKENRAKVNLSVIRAHARLCESCFDAFKAA